MFEILTKSLATGIVTKPFPPGPGEATPGFGRGRPEIKFDNWKDARPGATACPTGALQFTDNQEKRTVILDLAKCTFCGLCAEADSSITMTRICELAANRREDLITRAIYQLNPDGTQGQLLELASNSAPVSRGRESLESVGVQLKSTITRTLGRSLHVREVDAGSCNGCEVEIVGLNSPIYDVERFGIHFVASPRHADMLLVTGPVSRNMELALRKTYDATPDPKLVVAVGACGCGGGIFGQNYATVGSVDKVIPVDVYIPGCPPSPSALLRGILTALGRL
jgi:Ni,Fe-hydrogenase III small subunit/formate hydrogenlyase subunit 6/NADH:ubiquinone oxidoreductase subunit I